MHVGEIQSLKKGAQCAQEGGYNACYYIMTGLVNTVVVCTSYYSRTNKKRFISSLNCTALFVSPVYKEIKLPVLHRKTDGK